MPRFLAFAFCSDPYRDTGKVTDPACLSTRPTKFKFVSFETRLHTFDFLVTFCRAVQKVHVFAAVFVARQCSFHFCFVLLCPKYTAATPKRNPGNYSTHLQT